MAKKAKNILIADDDPIYREIAAETLAARGHKISIAADGGEAILLLAAQPFDLAILDITMPVADGNVVIEKLRQGALNATIPVIVITGHDDAEAIDRSFFAGATSFLTKPLNWMLFTPHVEFVLRCGETEAELREASATSAFLSDLKSQMMSALAQEFQTPLKTILNFSQLIDKEVFGAVTPPAYKDMLADIDKSARALNAALLKVMDFGHSLTEHLQINSEPVNARAAILDAIAAFETQAARRDIAIHSELAVSNEAVLQADRALFNQAMRSVLDNAIRLSPHGGLVTIAATTDANGNLAIDISDQGPHLAQALLLDVNGHNKPRLVAHHAQSSDVSIRIAKILTEAHKGDMRISNGPTAGNVVHLTIPLGDRGSSSALCDDSSTPLQRLARISAELADDPRIKNRNPVLTQSNRFSAATLLNASSPKAGVIR